MIQLAPLVPAQAGTQHEKLWMPAFAGMSGVWACMLSWSGLV